MLRKMSKNPMMLFVYLILAAVIVANIFISGYWIGRTQQLLDNIRPPAASAVRPAEN